MREHTQGLDVESPEGFDVDPVFGSTRNYRGASGRRAGESGGREEGMK